MRPTVWQLLGKVAGLRQVLRAIRFYPPYVGAGVRVRHVAHDLTSVEVEMALRGWNANYVGTQFGGSLYSMCDPFFMMMLWAQLGPEYVVWDKSARIDFLKPGRGKVRATFRVPAERADAVRDQVAKEGKALPTFEVDIVDEAGERIAHVHKELYVRADKRRARAPKNG